MQKFIKSFSYAFSGIAYAFKTQFNFKFHVVAVLIAGIAGWYFQLASGEWLWLIAASGLVIVAELFNTAIEVLVDLVSPAYHEKARIVKDVAAAAVLLAAGTALIIGLVIFIPKLLDHVA
ncbi:diacylglycerol kinase family protein [Pedobacter heparinus]|uniref:Diacylglycerol kinase n=1 Tax=Pedobacter heparinus (strain ATCC 13125 / DSM 2366 / CIP 104194 / JCM 7457 / NBRC 12017 / NCIMB 9290 / NRRL B-14731 / HIM 762-3) TaxID=485917 RepID=C6XZY9_PEDHD|nr:diacylglycerol kinase family protein [Pedobacter heparinus]ACU02684.1 diacylglycerol kinase [Pedobacter heparinus DSM 2366]